MRTYSRIMKFWSVFLIFALSTGVCVQSLPAQEPPPPSYTPEQLNQLVQRIALYPDPLLEQVLTAATYSDQIPDAAKWADEHHYLTGEALATAITNDQVPWDPSVQALLPFPSVLDMMASDMGWTTDLGNAVLAQRDGVMDAVQFERHEAKKYGYLRTAGPIVVSGDTYIAIAPANPAFIVVPAYNPGIVFAAPGPGFVVGGAIGFGFGVTIGAFFRPWGWGASRIVWADHAFFINNARWGRTWVNRGTYVHAYPGVHRYAPGAARVEHHEAIRRSDEERRAAREGRAVHEEHGHHEEHRR